jgi:hypothetical protein
MSLPPRRIPRVSRKRDDTNVHPDVKAIAGLLQSELRWRCSNPPDRSTLTAKIKSEPELCIRLAEVFALHLDLERALA